MLYEGFFCKFNFSFLRVIISYLCLSAPSVISDVYLSPLVYLLWFCLSRITILLPLSLMRKFKGWIWLVRTFPNYYDVRGFKNILAGIAHFTLLFTSIITLLILQNLQYLYFLYVFYFRTNHIFRKKLNNVCLIAYKEDEARFLKWWWWWWAARCVYLRDCWFRRLKNIQSIK